MSRSEAQGLQNRKRRATAARIAASAARLVAERGLAATTVDVIADDADVARATFFRYYDAKEKAVAEGITGPVLDRLVTTIAAQPPHLDAMGAITAAFREIAERNPPSYGRIREFARLTRSSNILDAWVLHAYRRYETAIAEAIAPRFPHLADHDPRPRMTAAMTMAAVRISLDDWIRHGGSLTTRISTALHCVTVGPPPQGAPEVQ
ncbi:MAG TPA: TetR family transcriptional regulator [Yinghuangia sp.]|uniref:TetR family transcriptional regulator n=1 Tax=Yinghuangia sp. YIM S10712 TaxID=3436930 RepID=UPI002C313A69|nr:TetR family transcriptional regulator [Yinghuangia sp.]